MNKIKNIYRTLILLLSLVLMPVEGWASDGYLVAEKANLYSAITSSKLKYACFYIEDNGTKLDFSSWIIKSGTVDVPSGESPNWIGFKKEGTYVIFTKPDYPSEENLTISFKPNDGVNIHGTKFVLLLSNNSELLKQKENLSGVTKMEFDLYTEAGLKSSVVKYGSNSVDFSKAESTSIIPKAATSTNVTLPDFNAKYLRWQLFESGIATTPVASITNILNNSSSVEKGSDLIYFHDTNIADDAARTVSFDFSKLTEGANVENYVLKCTWANNDNGDAKVVTYNGNTYVLQEPTLNGEYTFKFVKQETLDPHPMELSADNGTAAASHDVDAIYKDNKLEVSLKDVVSDILSDFGVADKKDVNDFYMRWVLADKDGNILSATSSNSALALRNTSENKGYYTLLSKDGSSLLPTGLDVTFELPSGSTWSSDMKVYCLLTNDLTGHEAKYGVITKEPSAFKSKINVKLYSPNDFPFKHYEGIANKKGDWDMVNGHTYQKTHEWEYYYYVDGKESNQQVMLKLPFQRYDNGGNDLEPRGYFRWYNYDTDKASDHLNTADATTKLQKKGDWGLFANNIGTHPTHQLIGVNYKTSHVNDSWEGETIACDVSRYVDGMDETRTYLLHEPTLSIRYIFHILPKKKLADDIMAALCNHDDGNYTYEDNKKVTFGFKDENSELTLRLQLNDITRYSFYPMTAEGLKKHVYDNDITEADFDKSNYMTVQWNNLVWRVYDMTKTKYCELDGKSMERFLHLTVKKLHDASWLNLDGTPVDAANKPVIDKGIPVFVVAYLNAQDKRCPVANFDVRFMDFHPMTDKQITDEGYNNRTISYLDEHYKKATKPISFDDDDTEQTLAEPTTPDDNQDRLPSRWDRRAYSFVYRDLIDYDVTNYGGGKNIGHSPLHGDYGLYKSAGRSDISGTGINNPKDGYLWWSNGTLYDRTYEMTNGSQYGHFLYIDASDESRQIAAADFKADLCTGMQLIFSAYVTDMTSQTIHPEVMFKLYGVNYDTDGNIQSQKLLHSFSSGDFDNNVDDLANTKWYQVYGKIVIQKESGVENYSDFRVVIDNYCKGTEGADYAIDDIRIYVEPAKVQVLQEKPICTSGSTGTIKLKIRAIHETLNAILNHTDTKIYFKFVDEDGNSVKTDYSYTLKNKTTGTTSIVPGTEYGTVDVYDSEEKCKNFDIDDTNMIEVDSEGETYIVISNKNYTLPTGKKYYVSVSTEDPVKGNANWGSPAELCSLYSSWFEMVSQHPVITDTKGKIVTDYKIPCGEAGSYSVKIKGQLVTTDPNTGGKITLDGVNFIWYIDGTGDANKVDPSAAASNEITISKDKLPLGKTHYIYMKPEGTDNDGYIEYTAPNGKKYLLCPSAIPVPLRVMLDGPQLNFGFNDVDYPFNDGDYEASLRIGLPQLEKLKASNGYLKVPLHSATMRDGSAITGPLTFIDDSKKPADNSQSVFVTSTNDPLWETKLNTPVATLENKELAIDPKVQSTLNLKFSNDAVENFHEGYYYVLRFAYEKRDASAETTNCPGESYLKVKIVPEFITWTPTADGGMNANWNNDANWHRSSSTELYNNEYKNYLPYGRSMSGTPTSEQEIPTLNSYVPMKFTKVTIDNLKGLPFPDLGNVVYRETNKIATKLTNGKGNEATKYIQYDIMAIWNEADANKGFEAAGNLKCEKFYGNTCHQIYFKPQGELRDQCYLVYDKAWVEKELEPNKWYTMASPLQYIYAGDMYVPASNGRQETPAFTDITFDTNTYSRSKYPVYQRAWMKSEVKEITPDGEPDHDAWHKPSGEASKVDVNLGYWSHVYNKVDESYSDAATFGGFSIKAGNALLPKDQTTNALLRLPKADTSYQYFDYNGTRNSSSETSVTKDPKGRGRLLVAFNNDEKHLAEKTQSLGTDNNSGFYLVANPYTCSISMAKFFEGNSGLKKAIWIVENGEVKATSTELDYKNYAIQPTQSFFVKKDDATVTDVRFTSTMCIDRTITPGLLMASDLKSIEATTENSNGQTSRARIALRPEASADYDDQEDVDLLYDQNLKDIPQVYTVAGNEAVAVNAVPELSWIPLGIVSQQAEEVSLTLKGVNKLDAPVYLYDAASASFTELHEGEAVKVKAGDHGRYFLTQTRTTTGIDRMEAEEQSAPVKVYSPAAGMIVVSALGGEKLDKVQVFTLDGKMVHSYQLPDKQRMILRVPSGIYIVKASTQSCAQAKGQKIAVR